MKQEAAFVAGAPSLEALFGVAVPGIGEVAHRDGVRAERALVTDQRRRVALAGSMCLVSFSASGA